MYGLVTGCTAMINWEVQIPFCRLLDNFGNNDLIFWENSLFSGLGSVFWMCLPILYYNSFTVYNIVQYCKVYFQENKMIYKNKN